MNSIFLRAVIMTGCLVAGAQAANAQSPVLLTAKELKWTDQAAPKGARHAVLWGDERSTEHAIMVRWPIGTKLADAVRSQEVHVLVLAGTVTIDVQGTYREFGPGGMAVVPKGVKHTLGCEAAGECRFLVHHPAPVQVSQSK
jgi:mannose-6-phosphate isomerase-like protein (cupin superfamily)